MGIFFVERKDRQVLLFLVLFTLFCFFLILFRVWYSDTITYTFLLWNLFLAWIPFVLSLVFKSFQRKTHTKYFFPLFLISWLVFFPNAPYILTDFFHLEPRQMVPLWYDLIIILSFSINGLFLGFFSLDTFHSFITKLYSRKAGWFFVMGSLFLASYGVYLGRYLRWNSWDILSAPRHLFGDVFEIVLHPIRYPGAYGMTFLFFVFLLFFYIFSRLFKKA